MVVNTDTEDTVHDFCNHEKPAPFVPLSIYCNTNQDLCILLPREDPDLVVFDKNSIVIFDWRISIHTLPPQNEVAYCVVGSAVVLDSWWGLREGRRENGLGGFALGPAADYMYSIHVWEERGFLSFKMGTLTFTSIRGRFHIGENLFYNEDYNTDITQLFILCLEAHQCFSIHLNCQ